MHQVDNKVISVKGKECKISKISKISNFQLEKYLFFVLLVLRKGSVQTGKPSWNPFETMTSFTLNIWPRYGFSYPGTLVNTWNVSQVLHQLTWRTRRGNIFCRCLIIFSFAGAFRFSEGQISYKCKRSSTLGSQQSQSKS